MSKHFLCSLLVCFSVFYGCGSDNPVTAVTPSGGQTTPGTGDAGGDPTKDNAYVFGTSSNGTLDIPGFWKKGSWVGLKNELDETKESLINDAGLFGTDYYIAGGMLNATDVTIPVYWKNGTYVKLVNGVDDQERFNAEVSSIIVASNVVYAGGYSLTTTDTRYHERCPGIWVDGTWSPIEAPCDTLDTTTNGYVTSMFRTDESPAVLYAAGEKRSTEATLLPGYWKDGVWNPLTHSITEATQTRVKKIVVAGAKVYVSGAISTSGPDIVGYWTDGTWTSLVNSIDSSKDTTANSLTISGQDVYVGGGSRNSSDKQIPGYWKNGTWTSLMNGETKNNLAHAEVSSIVISGTDIIATGNSFNGGYYVAGYWKNGVWNKLGNGIAGKNNKSSKAKGISLY